MQSKSTDIEINLLSLPEEVIHHLAGYLGRQDLLSLSKTCHSLRLSLNNDFIWRKYSHGSLYFHDLKSAVPPTFTEPDEDRTPICKHKMLVLRQNRSINNIRKGVFVENTVAVTNRIGALELKKNVLGCRNFERDNFPINFKQTLYKNKYLFALGFNQNIVAFKINDTIEPILSHLLLNRKSMRPKDCYSSICVVGDLIVVSALSLIEVYKVALPHCSFTLLHIIDYPSEPPHPLCGISNLIRKQFSDRPLDKGCMIMHRCAMPLRSYNNPAVIVGHYIFRIPETFPLVRAWDLQSGEELESILPKLDGPNFNILRFSLNEKYILLSVGLNSDSESESNPYLFVFDIESLEYTEFCAELEPSLSQTVCLGLIDDKYVVLISIPNQQRNRSLNDSAEVFVFDQLTSDQLVHKSGIQYYQDCSLHLVNGLLVVPSFQMIRVMSLKNLETVWKIQTNKLKSLEFISSPSSFCHLMVVAKLDNLVEFWEFEKKKKCFVLNGANSFTMDHTFSNLIVERYNYETEERNIQVLSFW